MARPLPLLIRRLAGALRRHRLPPVGAPVGAPVGSPSGSLPAPARRETGDANRARSAVTTVAIPVAPPVAPPVTSPVTSAAGSAPPAPECHAAAPEPVARAERGPPEGDTLMSNSNAQIADAVSQAEVATLGSTAAVAIAQAFLAASQASGTLFANMVQAQQQTAMAGNAAAVQAVNRVLGGAGAADGKVDLSGGGGGGGGASAEEIVEAIKRTRGGVSAELMVT